MSTRRSKESSGHMIGGLFTFMLFGAFVLLSLLIVVIGVRGYREVVDTSESLGAVRTSLGYVMGKLRSEAGSDGVRLEERNGVNTLVLTEIYEGEELETVIFYRDGALYELSQYAGYSFDPEDAWPLTEVASFEMEQQADGLLRLTATAKDGRAQTIHAAMRTEREVTGP